MEEALSTGEFAKQFGGSAAANMVTIVGVGILIGLKKLCDRPSRCKSHLHCPCLDVEVLDRTKTTIRVEPESADRTGEVTV